MFRALLLIKPRSLLVIIVTAACIRFGFIPGFGISTNTPLLPYAILVLCILCIASGAYVMNSFLDSKTDSINHPNRLIISRSLSQKQIVITYLSLTLLGLGVLIYLFLSKTTANPNFVFWSILSSTFILTIHSFKLKQIALIGNITLSLLVGYCVYLLGISLIEPTSYPVVHFLLIIYAILAFLLELSRSLLKDILNIRGDHFSNIDTLPILLGKKRTNYIIFAILTLIILIVMTVMLTYFLNLNVLIFYVFSFIVLPLILISKRILSATSKNDYKKINFQLFLIFIAGLSSMLIFLVL